MTSRSRTRSRSRTKSRTRSSRSRSISRSRSKRSYVTLDNGWNGPFTVDVQGKNVVVSKNTYDDEGEGVLIRKTPVHSITNAKKIFIGYDPPGFAFNDTKHNADIGNSILVNTKGDEYEYIGTHVERFRTVDGHPIKTYLSPVGNSAVPYPFGLSSTYAYLLVEGNAIPRSSMGSEKDPYAVSGHVTGTVKMTRKIIIPWTT